MTSLGRVPESSLSTQIPLHAVFQAKEGSGISSCNLGHRVAIFDLGNLDLGPLLGQLPRGQLAMLLASKGSF